MKINCILSNNVPVEFYALIPLSALDFIQLMELFFQIENYVLLSSFYRLNHSSDNAVISLPYDR